MNTIKSLGLLDPPPDTTFKRAISFKELKASYTLCYQIFLRSGYIDPNFMGMRIREWELHPETATFIARSGNRIIGTSSLAADLPLDGLPTEWLFPEEIARIRLSPGSIAEVCNGAVKETHRNTAIPLEFFRCMLATAWRNGTNKLVAVINKTHKAFYEFIYTIQIGEEKSYSADHYDPVILMYLDCDHLFAYLSSPDSDNGTADTFLRNYLLLQNPYLPLAGAWDRQAHKAFQRQRIHERFSDEIRNTLVASVFNDQRQEIREADVISS